MPTLEPTLENVARFFGGATVFTALLFLFIVGRLLLDGKSTSPGVVLALAAVVVLCAFVVGTGPWYRHRWSRLASWPATGVLIVLGFVGTAIGPQILGVATFALLTAVVMTVRDYVVEDSPTPG